MSREFNLQNEMLDSFVATATLFLNKEIQMAKKWKLRQEPSQKNNCHLFKNDIFSIPH